VLGAFPRATLQGFIQRGNFPNEQFLEFTFKVRLDLLRSRKLQGPSAVARMGQGPKRVGKLPLGKMPLGKYQTSLFSVYSTVGCLVSSLCRYLL